MKLVASVIVKDELDRYLGPFLTHLLEFVDEVRILDDGSSDNWADALLVRGDGAVDLDRLHVLRSEASWFWQDEGLARHTLLDWTLTGEPDWVLAIDADEFITDGAALRAACESTGASVLTVNMEEVWVATDECLCIRQDGGWRDHPVPILWRAPGATVLASDRKQPVDRRKWRITDRKVACGREPVAVRELHRMRRHVADSGVDVLHFGWACQADREARYQRYVEHDGGQYHASAHLRSIMFPDSAVKLEGRDWPVGLDPSSRATVLARANRAAAAAS